MGFKKKNEVEEEKPEVKKAEEAQEPIETTEEENTGEEVVDESEKGGEKKPTVSDVLTNHNEALSSHEQRIQQLEATLFRLKGI